MYLKLVFLGRGNSQILRMTYLGTEIGSPIVEENFSKLNI